MKRWIAFFALIVSFFAGCKSSPQCEITVGAAANLTEALSEMADLYTRQTGCIVRIHFAASGQIVHQVKEGAPLDLVVLANEDYVDELIGEGLAIPKTKAIYAQGKLVAWSVQRELPQTELLSWLVGPTVSRIAIANPEHAPYGAAAVEALKNAGVWDAVEPKIVYAENVRQALQYAQAGDADVALVPLSLVINLGEGSYQLVPEELYTLLNQALVVVKDTPHPDEARKFATFLTGPDARKVLERYGYTVPGR